MASAFAHAIAAVAVGKAFSLKNSWKFWLLGMLCAIIPDFDAIGFKLGVAYESFWGHRGFTHSFVFAALLAAVVVVIFYRSILPNQKHWWLLWLYFFIATATHPILDAMTTGGLGVAFFAPFDNTRYFLPWRPIQVSPIGIAEFFGERGMRVIKSELVWVFLPSLLFISVMYLLKRKKPSPQS
ncbi:metal-dependent hydrolase [soil metagenome]